MGVCGASDWSVSNTLFMLMRPGRYTSFGWGECVSLCVCVGVGVLMPGVVNLVSVCPFVHISTHTHTEHRPDRQVLISCHSYR